MDEPDLQFINFISSDKSPKNFGRYRDRTLDELYEKQSQTLNQAERKKLCRQFEIRTLDEMAYICPLLWRYRIVAHSAKMKGWKSLACSHLNLDLRDVWLDKD